MKCRLWFGAIIIGAVTMTLLAGPALAGDEEEPKRQVIDLKKLDIEGSVPNPSTMFIREWRTDRLFDLFPLERELPEDWYIPVIKGSFDRRTVEIIDVR